MQSAVSFEALLTFFLSSAGTNNSDLLGRNVTAEFMLQLVNILLALEILPLTLGKNRWRIEILDFEKNDDVYINAIF